MTKLNIFSKVYKSRNCLKNQYFVKKNIFDVKIESNYNSIKWSKYFFSIQVMNSCRKWWQLDITFVWILCETNKIYFNRKRIAIKLIVLLLITNIVSTAHICVKSTDLCMTGAKCQICPPFRSPQRFGKRMDTLKGRLDLIEVIYKFYQINNSSKHLINWRILQWFKFKPIWSRLSFCMNSVNNYLI